MIHLTPLSKVLVAIVGLCLIALATIWLVGCATLNARYRNPDGSFNPRAVLHDIDWGLAESCQPDQLTLPAVVCVDGRDALEAALAVSTNDPVLFVKSAVALLETATHNHPELVGWFEFGQKLFLDYLKRVAPAPTAYRHPPAEPYVAWAYPIVQAAV